MKKYLPIIILVMCGIGYLGYYFLVPKETDKATKESQTSEATLDNLEKSSSTKEKEVVSEATTDSSEPINHQKLIEEFTQKWTNFDDIYERNQSVKPLVTDKYSKDNTLDVNPHVEYQSKGKIEGIYQEVESSNKYVVIGKEKSKDYVNDFVLEVTVDESQQKINEASLSYVKKGY